MILLGYCPVPAQIAFAYRLIMSRVQLSRLSAGVWTETVPESGLSPVRTGRLVVP